ncbi:hypothetical protein ZIOFF_030923 [Zingiber officinale]|uniref:Uncharacterized protein n=1 Tax=Zingiber officinale TaxID=94328 RepID=A0A8J5H5L6_ZINOF|nr:hypothetical protein ZIOFF_030923 [Zingiber officinale]
MAFVAVAVYTLPSLSYARRPQPQLTSSFLAPGWHLSLRHRPLAKKQQQQQGRSRRRGGLVVVVVDELAGQYDEGFEDVHVQLINYFTYKAVRTVLHQLYEMNPPSYRWLYNFVVNNKPTDGKRFLRALAKVRIVDLLAFDLRSRLKYF